MRTLFSPNIVHCRITNEHNQNTKRFLIVSAALLVFVGLEISWQSLLLLARGPQGTELSEARFGTARTDQPKNGTSYSLLPVSEVQWVTVQTDRDWRYSIQRFGDAHAKNNTIPEGMLILDNKLLWCPNAKAGTSSIYKQIIFPMNIMGDRNERCYSSDCPNNARRVFNNSAVGRKAVKRAPSFTIVRNPWDRLRSAYVDKLVSKQIVIPKQPGEELTAEEKRKAVPVSFNEFVRHVERHPDEDIHWRPHSVRCLSAANDDGEVFHYDHVIKIEDGMFEQLERIFGWYGLPFPEGPKRINVKSNASMADRATRDGALRKFYAEAATLESMESLVLRVGRIYVDDVVRHGYSFPWEAI